MSFDASKVVHRMKHYVGTSIEDDSPILVDVVLAALYDAAVERIAELEARPLVCECRQDEQLAQARRIIELEAEISVRDIRIAQLEQQIRELNPPELYDTITQHDLDPVKVNP